MIDGAKRRLAEADNVICGTASCEADPVAEDTRIIVPRGTLRLGVIHKPGASMILVVLSLASWRRGKGERVVCIWSRPLLIQRYLRWS